MKRHLLIGRFGSTDTTNVASGLDEEVTALELLRSTDMVGHGVGHALHDMQTLNLEPDEIAVDLLILAALVHAADTRLSRASEAQDSWTREIRLVVPVSDPPRWNAARPILGRMLNFLTGDRWTIDFRSRPADRAKLAQVSPRPLAPPAFDGVSLFSGGMDSLIGAIDSLEAGDAPLFVSHAGEGAVSKSQEGCFDALRSAHPNASFDRLRIWMAFEQGLFEDVAGESSTRGRSFLFFSLGVAAGIGLGSNFVLKVPENGLIALNVPLDQLRLGALSTRTTHPFYMARWNELLTVLEVRGHLENPYWNKTKGEMVAECANPDLLASAVPVSLSCSSPAKQRWKGEPQGHCGYCLPCLIRRASLLGNDPTSYGIDDLSAQALDTTQAEGQQVRSFQVAINRLRRRPDLAAFLIHKPGPLSDELTRWDSYSDVYRRGMEEVDTLLSNVTTEPS